MTKIVGTLGPKSRSVEVISGCLKAGMSGMIGFCLLFVRLHTHTHRDGLASFVSRIVMVLKLVGALIVSGPVRLFVGRPGIPQGDSGESEGGCEEY